MDRITLEMKKHYTETFERYGANVQGVDWGDSKEDSKKLELRYCKMLEIIKHLETTQQNISILDVGCGYGGLHKYALDKGLIFDYTGIDICENMINYARESDRKGTYILGDILECFVEKNFTFVVCNGILTQKLGISIREMDAYARKLIKRMWELSTQGIVFNIMKSQVDYMKDSLYYKSPLEILAYCMMLTDKFVLDSSYYLYEYCVYLYKN